MKTKSFFLGAFMELLVRLCGARRAVEVGTFTGYSALCIARALGPGGRLLCLDTSAEWTAVARRYWERAGVADRIELRLGPGAVTLAGLPREELFDFGFIDADKPGYRTYYEEILARLRPGGLIVCDNVLWGGSVADPAARDDHTEKIRAFNDFVAADQRVERAMIAVGDGLTLARKR
jgi:caffeoyl-CoA O-methyltransferase